MLIEEGKKGKIFNFKTGQKTIHFVHTTNKEGRVKQIQSFIGEDIKNRKTTLISGIKRGNTDGEEKLEKNGKWVMGVLKFLRLSGLSKRRKGEKEKGKKYCGDFTQTNCLL